MNDLPMLRFNESKQLKVKLVIIYILQTMQMS
jgi:hypothetical protein